MKSVRRGWLGSETFTRRTATVTISAPDASTAAAFSSKLLYLPVPTISREVKLRPATVQPSALMSCCTPTSATSDKMHDLERVPVFDANLAERGARDDLEVPLDGNAPGVQPKLVQHLDEVVTARHAPVLAV